MRATIDPAALTIAIAKKRRVNQELVPTDFNTLDRIENIMKGGKSRGPSQIIFLLLPKNVGKSYNNSKYKKFD